MSPSREPKPSIESDSGVSRVGAAPRPFYWSVRRELWENRSLVIAPLAVTGLVLLASLISMIGLPGRMEAFAELPPVARQQRVAGPFALAPAPIMLATFLIGFFYALDALYGERRDRSLLFWKSLPVSDRTTVLAKAAIPAVVLPSIALVLSLATLAVMLVVSTIVLVANGVNPVLLWSGLSFVQQPVTMVYGLVVHALWFAPIYCWVLLISGWARRAPLLWVALPPLALAAVERIFFDSSNVASFLKYRVAGAMARGFAGEPVDMIEELTPLRFMGTPGLWGGLAFAAACLAVAIRLRRNREPN